MSELLQVYKCGVCGNIVEVVFAGQGKPSCCGEPMELLEEKSKDQGMEKHVPVIEKTDTGVKVKIGAVPHPMEDEHHIAFVELVCGCGVNRINLKPGDSPEAKFCCGCENISAREYCTVHGLWKS